MANFLLRQFPNTLTCCNLISGSIATYYAFSDRPVIALLFIVVGAVFDFFDGFAARLLHVSSPIGKELDSLADDITFGMAPASIVYMLLSQLHYSASLEEIRNFVPFIAFLIAAFSALRLAKFNLDTRQTTSFIGLPTPANALFWASFAIGMRETLQNCAFGLPVVLLIVLLSCYLLVCELPMFALKFKSFGWKDNKVKYMFLLICIPLIIVFRLASLAPIVLIYIVLSMFTQKK
jgi:CDP-diacylglycerol--serine O-phosphatidyltransferase